MNTNLLAVLMDHRNQHIIAALGARGGLRFARLARETGLDNKALANQLKKLRQTMVVVATTIPSKGERVWLEYGLTPRGEAMYGVLSDLRESLAKRRLLAPAARQFEEVFDGHVAVA